MTDHTTEEVKDFTNHDKKADIPFKIDNDTFIAVGEPPGGAVLDISAVNKAEPNDKLRIVMDFLDKVLRPTSAERFAERFSDPDEPISINQAADIAVWLMQEKYFPERPTEAPSPSPNGSGSIGPSSTDGAPPTESTRII